MRTGLFAGDQGKCQVDYFQRSVVGAGIKAGGSKIGRIGWNEASDRGAVGVSRKRQWELCQLRIAENSQDMKVWWKWFCERIPGCCLLWVLYRRARMRLLSTRVKWKWLCRRLNECCIDQDTMPSPNTGFSPFGDVEVLVFVLHYSTLFLHPIGQNKVWERLPWLFVV